MMLSLNIGSGSHVKFSPDGKRIALADEKDVLVCNSETGKVLHRLGVQPGYFITSLAFSPDGRNLLSACQRPVQKTTRVGTALSVWDALSGEPKFTLLEDRTNLASAQFSPNGERIVVGDDEAVRVWDASDGKLLLTLKGQAAEVSSVVYSPDNRRIASGSKDGTVRMWDATTGQEKLVLKGPAKGVSSLAFTPDGARLVCGGADGVIAIWDAPDPKAP
jgi:WD40 repeat protein